MRLYHRLFALEPSFILRKTDASVNIVSLCDGLLLTIHNELNNVDVLYSLIDVSRKTDRLDGGITFTQYVDRSRIHSRKKSMLDRFCLDLLPRIRRNNHSCSECIISGSGFFVLNIIRNCTNLLSSMFNGT